MDLNHYLTNKKKKRVNCWVYLILTLFFEMKFYFPDEKKRGIFLKIVIVLFILLIKKYKFGQY